ncbi:MAG: tripartite tricarboxylate transporter substrate-binding protein [Deltaproteobacteria bacterium]|nr:tripartite tricarboxylate transporter substrate-binding protein [Deltaproteobacteria bacterium]
MRPYRLSVLRVALALGIALIAMTATAALAADDFYKGKTVRIIVGSAPGGGFDAYARLVGRHIGKHIPGAPRTLVTSMTGAGNLIAANYMYNRAKPDGLTIGHWVGTLVLQQVLGNKRVQFDARKFEWITVPKPSYTACVVAKDSGITTMDQWLAAKQPLKLGGMGPGSSISDIPRLVESITGVPLKLVEGYGGAARVRLAIEKREVFGGCWSPDVILSYWPKSIPGELNFVVQVGVGRHPRLPDVPNILELAKSEDQRQFAGVVGRNAHEILRAFSLPPGTPKARVELLRKAFAATFKDPELLAEAKKANLIINPIPGPRVVQAVNEFFALDAELLARLKGILVPKQ